MLNIKKKSICIETKYTNCHRAHSGISTSAIRWRVRFLFMRVSKGVLSCMLPADGGTKGRPTWMGLHNGVATCNIFCEMWIPGSFDGEGGLGGWRIMEGGQALTRVDGGDFSFQFLSIVVFFLNFGVVVFKL